MSMYAQAAQTDIYQVPLWCDINFELTKYLKVV